MNELENINISEQDLLAENRRLKHLLNRLSGLGASSSVRSCSVSEINQYLPLSISQILISEKPFEQRIEEVLQYLGEFSDVSRVYIFEDINNCNCCNNTFEWCNHGVNPQNEHLYKLQGSTILSWKRILDEEGFIIASNIKKELSEEFHSLFEAIDIKSFMILPLLSGNKRIGYIGFDECSYSRHWLEVEIALLSTAAHLLGNAFQQHNAIIQINENLHIQKFLYKAASSLNNPDTLEISMDSITKELLESWDLSMVAIYNRNNSDPREFNLFSWAFKDGKGCFSPQKISLSSFESVSVFPENYYTLTNPVFSAYSEDLSGYGFPDKTGKLIAISSKTGINGIIVLIWNPKLQLCPLSEVFLETLSVLIAKALDHHVTYQQNKEQHSRILEINKKLSDNQQFLNSIISSAPVGIILCKDRIIQYVNNHIIASGHFKNEELIGKHLSEIYATGYENLEDIKRFYQEINENGISSINSIIKKKNDGNIFYHLIGTQVPIYNSEKYILLIGQDLTKIKEAEKELHESEERNNKILEATNDGIFIMSNPGKLEFINNSGCQLTGYSNKELTCISLEQLFPDRQNFKDFLRIFTQIRKGIDYKGDNRLRHRNGSTLYVEIFGTSIILKGKTHYYFNIHDITKRKQNEAALMLSEKKFRSLSENLPDCILRVNQYGLIIYSNTLFVKLFDLKTQENITNPVFHIDELPVDKSTQFKKALFDVFGSKKIVHQEISINKNQETLIFDWSLSPEFDLTGQCVSMLGIGRDITQRKKVEEELFIAKEQAEAADRLKSAFLANMSHEIRTPLNAIVGFSNLLNQGETEEESRDEYISIINQSADILMSVINDIIDIAIIESGQLHITKKSVEVNQLINPLFNTYKKKIDAHFKGKVKIILSKPYFPDQVFVDADETRLLQVLNNLLDNAVKFIHEGHIEFGYSFNENRIRFFVKDTGIGIAKENMKIIFQAFRQEEETSSKQYGGTGLGLAISKKLIEAMGGEIDLISEKGKGSEFIFHLNSSQTIPQSITGISVAQKENVNQINQTPNWSNRMLLLVDENSSVHLHLKKQLEKTRITVLSARSGSSARNLILNRNDIDLVIMDNHLPDINAMELSRQIREAGVQIPLIVQTNKESDEEKMTLMQAGFNTEIEKPVQSSDLITKISYLLNYVN